MSLSALEESAPAAWYADSWVWNMELSPKNAKKSRFNPSRTFDLYSKEAEGLFKKWDFNSGGHHGNLSSLNDDALMLSNPTELQRN